MNYASILSYLNRNIGVDFFLFENVAGLVTGHKHSLARFIRLFKQAGFTVYQYRVDAASFGVPQHRDRLIVVGFNSAKYDLAKPFIPPRSIANKLKTVRDAIGHLPEPSHFRSVNGKVPYHPNHWCMNPRSEKFTKGLLKPGECWGHSFRVLAWDKPSWTVAYGNREVHVHPSCKRRLSVLEAMLLQGFPESYTLVGTLSEQIKLVSDAVPPPLACAFARAIRTYLKGKAAPVSPPPSPYHPASASGH